MENSVFESHKLLLKVVNFWTKRENVILLNKGMVFDGETNTWPSMDCTCTKNKSGEIKANIYCPKCSKRTLKEIRMSELEKI